MAKFWRTGFLELTVDNLAKGSHVGASTPETSLDKDSMDSILKELLDYNQSSAIALLFPA